MPHKPLRRPSTLALVAGLLAADRLRRLAAPWTGATPIRIASKPLCDPSLSRPLPRRRKSMRTRILMFVLFVALLVALPAALVTVLS